MIEILVRATLAVLFVALCAGCATTSPLSAGSARKSEKLLQHAADLLISGVNYTRSSSREVAGWCWSDGATKKLAHVSQTRVGEYTGVGVVLPVDSQSTRYVSCSWHTHPWGSHVAPGPSKKDLRNSMHPRVIEMMHFVLDQHGIWQYSRGQVIEMCPWNSDRTDFEMASCRPGSQSPAKTYVRVERFYGQRE
jgi:hypothetical protein